ncbi:aminodeoxychorismate lyase [soil metagenome]
MAGRLAAGDARALVDGVPVSMDDARLPLVDAGLVLGDGAFETIGVWGGRPFLLADHLDRLDASLAALVLPPSARGLLEEECRQVLAGLEVDAALRIHLTSGGTRAVSLSPLPPRTRRMVLVPQPAPWVQPAGAGGAAGAKSMSYGPNLAARRRARQEGGDDALLYSVPDRFVLEGATAGILFVARGVVHAPDTALGIVDSISRRTLLEVATDHHLDVLIGRWPLESLADADEVLISTSLRPATAVQKVGPWSYGRTHPVTDLLARGLRTRRRKRR